MLEKNYLCETCKTGNIYYPKEGMVFTAEASVNYIERPWISCCETEGIEIVI